LSPESGSMEHALSVQHRLPSGVSIGSVSVARSVNLRTEPQPSGSGLRAAFGIILTAFVLCSAAPAATFYKDALPILQRNCQTCHRPGEAGPMSLTTYEETRPWAKAIKTAVVTRKMPPWFADDNGHFANDPRLSEKDIAIISQWVDGGAL